MVIPCRSYNETEEPYDSVGPCYRSDPEGQGRYRSGHAGELADQVLASARRIWEYWHGLASEARMSLLKNVGLVIVFLASMAHVAQGMTFQTVPSIVDGRTKIVIAEGTIENGDAARFKATIEVSPPDAHLLLVTSQGGSVAAAMELAQAIRARSYSVVVVRECASACAQILFPAGEYSILRRGSLLGIHSCSAAGVRNDLCNEVIAEFAVSNGFPYGTLQLFSDLYGPGEMKWMSEISARCFGFYRGLGDPKPVHGRKACVDGYIFTMQSSATPRPFGPSFDCTKATSRIERLFCIDRELMQTDSILGRVYDAALNVATPEERARIRTDQRNWIHERNTECDAMLPDKLDFASTRVGAMCLYRHNEERIYTLIDQGTF